MSLFSSGDVKYKAVSNNSPVVGTEDLNIKTAAGDKISTIAPAILSLEENDCIYFMTDGAWSNIDLVEKILSITGACDIHFCTWSISTDAIRKFTDWQQKGLISSLFVILDQGLSNRKPEIFQQAFGAFKNLKLLKCHAKVIVIQNLQYSFTIVGSANFTNNPRKEAGLIIRNSNIAQDNINWIRKEFDDA